MTGRYLQRGQPVTLLLTWCGRPVVQPGPVLWLRQPSRHGPRNCLIRRADGTLVVRPFRGRRRAP